MTKISTFMLGSLILAIAAMDSAEAVQYEASNSASSTPGGTRFNDAIGLDFSKQVLADASSFIWGIFGQANDQDRKSVTLITLTIESMGAEYIGNYAGDVRTEFVGVMYHEVTHVWQWNGAGVAPSGVIEGMADYVRLKAGYAPSHWVKPGGGSRWDQGYDVTARFFDYLNDRKNGFVAELNAMMKTGYSDDFFMQLLGKSVDQLWSEYKAQYN